MNIVYLKLCFQAVVNIITIDVFLKTRILKKKITIDARGTKNEEEDGNEKTGAPANDHSCANALEIGFDPKILSVNERLDSKDVECGLNDHHDA